MESGDIIYFQLMAHFGKEVSELEEIVYDEDGPGILFGVGSENYKDDVQISKRPPNILAVEGNCGTSISLNLRSIHSTVK